MEKSAVLLEMDSNSPLQSAQPLGAKLPPKILISPK
jgi:hypothetical protein